jgi:hypothetical protein
LLDKKKLGEVCCIDEFALFTLLEQTDSTLKAKEKLMQILTGLKSDSPAC